MDYPVQLSTQLRQLLRSLRKSHQLTQAELALQLGVVQSRIADIERDPGAVSVEQMLHLLAILGAQLVVREVSAEALANRTSLAPQDHAKGRSSATTKLTVARKPKAPTSDDPSDAPPADEPRGQW